MQSHSESITSNIKNKENQTSLSTIPTALTWLHGDETEQVLSKLPEMEQKIVHSFLNQLADKEKIKTPISCHKFFDPMAGP
jgi:hypothetical protein